MDRNYIIQGKEEKLIDKMKYTSIITYWVISCVPVIRSTSVLDLLSEGEQLLTYDRKRILKNHSYHYININSLFEEVMYYRIRGGRRSE